MITHMVTIVIYRETRTYYCLQSTSRKARSHLKKKKKVNGVSWKSERTRQKKKNGVLK